MKRVAFMLIALTLAFTADAQLLWRVSGGGVEKPSYIFGTHHMASYSITDSIRGFKDAFAACSRVYGEVVMDSMMMPEVQMGMARKMAAPPDSTLHVLLSPDEYARVDSLTGLYLGIGLQQLDMLKPAVLSAQLVVVMSMKAFPEFDVQNQLDALLQQQARSAGKAVFGLESLDSQVDLLYGAPLSEQADDLLSLLEPGHEKEMHELADAYMRQDLETLQQLVEESEGESSPEELDRMIYDRNRRWAETLAPVFADAPSFVVVGAGHLPGDRGLLALLREKGYTVEPVM